MKSYLFAFLAFLFISSAVQAQHVNMGVKGGLNVYNIGGDNSSGNNARIGFNFGILGHIHHGDHFAMQPELVYSLQGTSYRAGGNDVDLNLNYVNIPILFQYMFDNGFRLEAGPQIGVLTSAKRVINENSAEVNSDYKGADISLALGMSYVNPPTGFGFDIRYNYGLTDINKNNSVSSYNKGLQLGVFYIFNQSHKTSDK